MQQEAIEQEQNFKDGRVAIDEVIDGLQGAINNDNVGNHNKNLRGSLCRSNANYIQSLQNSMTVTINYSFNYFGCFEHETHFSI